MYAPINALSLKLLLQHGLPEQDDEFWPVKSPPSPFLRQTKILGTSAAAQRLRTQVHRMGPYFRTALILGERGLHKEEIARALHEAVPATKGAFVICNGELIASLAATEAGERTGGNAKLEQLLTNARGGTIFIPELGRLALNAQTSLLQLLDVIEAATGDRIRVIASLTGDPRSMISAGTLLPQLEEKLGVIALTMTPLRERPEDIGEIAAKVLADLAAELDANVLSISPAALQKLETRPWSGNERELEIVLRLATASGNGVMIEAADLPAAVSHATSPAPVEADPGGPTKLDDVIEAHVQAVLRRCEGNKLKAAEMLGISRSTLYRMLDSSNSTPDRAD